MSHSEVDDALRAGRLIIMHRGIFRHPSADERDPWVAGWAAVLTQFRGTHRPQGIALSHHSAAGLWRLEGVPASPLARLAVPAGWTGHSRPAVRLHRVGVPAGEGRLLDGLPLTSPALTVMHLAAILPEPTALVIADSALRSKLCSAADISAAGRLLAGRGRARAREVAALCRHGVDSCAESLLRLVIVRGELPEPVVGYSIDGGAGGQLARADLAYPRPLLWIEYDGYEVHAERGAFRRDRSRQNWLQQRGWLVLRYTDVDLRRPAVVAGQVRAALAQAPQRVAALPWGLSAEADAAKVNLPALNPFRQAAAG